MRALLIGNDEAALEAVQRVLRARGLGVVRRREASGDGLAEFGIAVVVALGSRGLGAEASVRALRGLPGGDVPVIFVITDHGTSDAEALEALVEAGASDFLLWPRDAEYLGPRLATVEQRAVDRRRARAGLRELLQRHEAVLDAAPVVLHTTDAEGRITSVSDAWLAALGYRREEVLGRHSLAFFSDDARRRAADDVLPRMFATGLVEGEPLELVRKDGTRLPVRLSAVAQRDAAGVLIGALAVCLPLPAARGGA